MQKTLSVKIGMTCVFLCFVHFISFTRMNDTNFMFANPFNGPKGSKWYGHQCDIDTCCGHIRFQRSRTSGAKPDSPSKQLIVRAIAMIFFLVIGFKYVRVRGRIGHLKWKSVKKQLQLNFTFLY